LFIFSQNAGFFRYSSLSGDQVFLPRQKPGLENSTVSSMSKPTAIGGRPSRLFSIWATDTQCTGACWASCATLVPGLSGDGDEACAVTEPLRVNSKLKALRISVILRIVFPALSVRNHCNLSGRS